MNFRSSIFDVRKKTKLHSYVFGTAYHASEDLRYEKGIDDMPLSTTYNKMIIETVLILYIKPFLLGMFSICFEIVTDFTESIIQSDKVGSFSAYF